MKTVSTVDAETVVEYLLETDLVEATVRRPPRSKRWVAVYTGVEPGTQMWRSTGLIHRTAALALARRWEAQARRRRAASFALARKPTIRVRRGSGEAGVGLLTQEETAAILRISVRAIRNIERRAFAKLRRHPALRRFWREYTGQTRELPVEEAGEAALSDSEVVALMALARTPPERFALAKLLLLIGVVPPAGTWSWP